VMPVDGDRAILRGVDALAEDTPGADRHRAHAGSMRGAGSRVERAAQPALVATGWADQVLNDDWLVMTGRHVLYRVQRLLRSTRKAPAVRMSDSRLHC